MRIFLDRFQFTDKATISTITAGSFHCYALEDVDRYLECVPDGKIYGQTAIPRGKYQVVITYSQRFQKELPLLLDVPNFRGVRIHPGNYAEDTDGCILPGTTYSDDFVGNSRMAFLGLYAMIRHAIDAGEYVELEVL